MQSNIRKRRLVTFCVFFMISFYIYIPSTKAITRATSYDADADSYVRDGEPNDSFGASDWCFVGDYFYGTHESFFKFTLPSMSNIDSVFISIFVYSSVDSPLDLAICLIEEDWNGMGPVEPGCALEVRTKILGIANGLRKK